MRRKRLSKIAAVSLAVSLCVGTMAGCGKKDEKAGSGDLYSALKEAQELKAGSFEMTLGMEVPQDDEKMELSFSGVTTDESFDIEVGLKLDADGMDVEGAVTQLVYEDEHLYINVAKAMDFLNSVEEIGDLSDFGIDSDYIDIYVGDLYEQTDNTAAEEMADIFLEIIEDAAVSTDKKEGAGKDGSIEFKDEDVLEFIGNLAQGIKDNAEDIVDSSAELSEVSYDYDAIFDYYGDLFEEYDLDIDALKAELDAVEDMEITDEDKESMVEEIETACDELIDSMEEEEDSDVEGSKISMEASLEGKKGSRTYEAHVDFVAASEDEGEEVIIYFDYVFEEGEKKVEVPEDSLELDEVMEILEPFFATTEPEEPEITDPTVTDPATVEDFQNEDGSFALSCDWDSLGRMDFFAPEGFEFEPTFSRSDFHVYGDEDYNTLYVSVYEGADYKESFDYEYTLEQGDVPTGTISTPVGEMEYIVDNTDSYYTIYGFVAIDSNHYLDMEYTVKSSDEPTVEKCVQYLTKFAEGLKVAQ